MKIFVPCFLFATLATGLMAGAEEGSFDRSLSVSGPVNLDVTTEAGGITVLSGSPGSLQVHAILKAQGDWLGSGDVKRRIDELERNPPVEQTGNRIRIGYVQDRALLKGISIRFELQAPPTTQLRARADSGGIRVDGIQGPVDCQTASGGIRIHAVKADVRAGADSGGIDLNHITGAVFARVASGGIDASEVAGSIDAQTDSGGIQVSQTKPAPIRAKADSGAVRVRLTPGSGYDLSVEADSGPISVPEMTVRSGFSAHHVEGKVGSGGPLVQIRVDSGSVKVE